MRKAVIAVVLAALLSANLNTVAHAQGDLVAPSNVVAQNTGKPGEVRVSWEAVPGAAYYRIGWVAYADVEPIIATGGDWLERFAFIDIQNRGQTQHTITRLTPGVQYAFILASNDGRYGTPRWPDATGWRFLNLAQAPASQAAIGTASVNVTWEAVAGATHYRIGWVVYEDVAPIIAAGGDWLERFAFIDIANRGQTGHTITRLTPRLQYAFIVAGNDGRYGTPQWPDASGWQFMTPGAQQLTGPDADRAALVALYNATRGADWRNNSNWLSNEPIDEWHGVTADEHGRVAELNLRGNNLTGGIPSALGDLSNLERLDLQSNGLSGSIPGELGNLTNLRWLDLDQNSLTGTLPPELGNLANLVKLDLDDNLLTGSIPSELENLASLEFIELAENAFTGCIPAALQNIADNDLAGLALPFCGVSPARQFTTSQLETLFDEIISKTEQREAFSPVKESNIGFSAIGDMRALRSEFAASRTETELFYALSKLSNARRDRHLRVSPVDGGLQAPDRAPCVSAPIHVLPDLSDIDNPTFFVAAVGEGRTLPNVGDVIVSVNGRTIAEHVNEFTPWIRHSSLPGLYWRMAYELPALVATVPPSIYSGQLDLTLENSSGQRYDVSLPYSVGCRHFGLTASYPDFVEVMGRENFNVLIDASREIIVLQWLDFEHSLIQDIMDLMEYAEREQILDYDMIIDVTWSGGGSRGAYAIQRLVDQPFRVTFGNVRLSDAGKELIERFASREPIADAPDIFGLNLSRSWLIDWARTDAMEAIRRGDDYTPAVPFKLAHLPKDSDGILQPAPVHFSGEVAVINARTWGGSHLDQFMAMFVDNDLATFVGVPTGAYSNTWEDQEVLGLPETGQPLAEFMWSIGHTIRPNGAILEGNPAQPDFSIPLTRDNFQRYHQILFSQAVDALGQSIPPPTPTPVAAVFEGSDRDVLVAFYHATGGPSWNDDTNWLSDAPIGQWYGVTADANGRVTELHLRRNQLSGEIPPEIENLTELRRLFVQSNSISGPIPLQITNLTNLTRLNLGANRFTGEIPAELGNLLNMERLELRENQLTGNIPPELGNLVDLRILWLPGNRLSGEIPQELSGLVALEILGLQGNRLTGPIPPWLGDLPRLTRLELGGNRLTGDVPALFKDRTLAAVKLLPWVEDGLNNAERGEYDHLLRSVNQYPQGVATVLDKGWLVDGVSTAEFSLIKYLGQMPPDVMATVIAMPFMQSVDPADPNAVAALQQLERNDRESFDRIMAHPTMADGIDDDEAKIVTFLYGTNENRKELVEPLLSGSGIYIEERTIELPLAGETLLLIVRVRDQPNRLMGYWEYSVRNMESFVGEPFPTNYGAMLLPEFDPEEKPEGVWPGTHTTLSMRYDDDYWQSEESGEAWAGQLAHELGHYYFGAWGRMRTWMAEGAAQFLGNALSEHIRTGKSITPTLAPCRSATTIAELDAREIYQPGTSGERRSDIENAEAGGTEEVDDRWLCNYTLGERLFLDLYQGLPKDAFHQGLGNLYRKTQYDDPSDDCEGTYAEICHLRAAFKEGATADEQQIVDEIVNKWYYGE